MKTYLLIQKLPRDAAESFNALTDNLRGLDTVILNDSARLIFSDQDGEALATEIFTGVTENKTLKLVLIGESSFSPKQTLQNQQDR